METGADTDPRKELTSPRLPDPTFSAEPSSFLLAGPAQAPRIPPHLRRHRPARFIFSIPRDRRNRAPRDVNRRGGVHRVRPIRTESPEVQEWAHKQA